MGLSGPANPKPKSGFKTPQRCLLACKQATYTQLASNQASKQASTQIGPGRARQGQVGPDRPMQAQAGPGRPRQGRAGPGRPRQVQAGPGREEYSWGYYWPYNPVGPVVPP